MGNQIAKEDPVIVQRYLPDPFLINGYKEDDQIIKPGGFFWIFFSTLYSTLLHLPYSESTVSENAGIEPRTFTTSALVSQTL